MSLHLSGFLKKLDNFIREMIDTYPMYANELADGYAAFQLVRDANPFMILTLFNDHIAVPFYDQIINEDEEFIRTAAEGKLKTEFPQFYEFFEPCVNLWDTMSPESKEATWKHMKVLVVLSKKAVSNS